MNERTFKPSEAHKLEDPERLKWLPPGEILDNLHLRAGMRIADIGAGTGYFALPFARAVAPDGLVYAVDLQPEMLDLLRGKLANGEPVELRQGTAHETGLPAGECDLVFLANVWHELDGHAGVLAEAARILKPGGCVAILDWRTGVERPPGPPLDHRIGADEAARMLEQNGWALTASVNVGRYHYLAVAGR